MNLEQLNTVTVDISSLKFDPKNARKHNERNLEAIKASLEKFGQVEPLVVRKSNHQVIGGNGRLEVMKSLGWTSCNIVELDISEKEAISLGISLNRSGELASWDENNLAELMEFLLIEAPEEVEVTGFSDDDIEAIALILGASEPPRLNVPEEDFYSESEESEPVAEMSFAQQLEESGVEAETTILPDRTKPETYSLLSQVKMVQLYLNMGNFGTFEENMKVMKKRYGTENTTDTVLAALVEVMSKIEGEK